MRQVTLSVSSWDEIEAEFVAAFRGEEQGHHISFATPELLWKTLTHERWELLSLLTGREPMTVEVLAAEAGRDSAIVAADLDALALAGVIERLAGGLFHFPYDAVHVDFVLKRAA